MKKTNLVKNISAASFLMMWIQSPIVAAEAYQQHKEQTRPDEVLGKPEFETELEKPVIGRKENAYV